MLDATIDDTAGRVPPKFLIQEFPSYCACSHLQFEVPGIVDELKESNGCIVSGPIIKSMNSRIAPRPVCITLGEGGKKFREYRRFQNECLGLAIRSLVVLLSQRNDLFTRKQTARDNNVVLPSLPAWQCLWPWLKLF